jgi:hypothetical protein
LTLFLKVIEKQQESPISIGFVAQKLGSPNDPWDVPADLGVVARDGRAGGRAGGRNAWTPAGVSSRLITTACFYLLF